MQRRVMALVGLAAALDLETKKTAEGSV